MKCFNHAQADAVGVCANCGKGLCSGCVTRSQSGKISCSPGCSAALLNVELTVRVTRDRGFQAWRAIAGLLWVIAALFAGFSVFLAIMKVWLLVWLLVPIVLVFIPLGFMCWRWGTKLDLMQK